AVVAEVLRSVGVAPTRQRDKDVSGRDRAEDQAGYVEAVRLLSSAKDAASVDRAIAKLDSLLPNARDSAVLNGELSLALIAKYGMTRQKNLADDAALYAERSVQFDPHSPTGLMALAHTQLITGHASEAAAS